MIRLKILFKPASLQRLLALLVAILANACGAQIDVPNKPTIKPKRQSNEYDYNRQGKFGVGVHSQKLRSLLRVDETVSLEEQIAQRAHELWHQRKREHGHDLIDWLQAESEINEWH